MINGAQQVKIGEWGTERLGAMGASLVNDTLWNDLKEPCTLDQVLMLFCDLI